MAKVLVAVAWPYANGVIHLGHMAGSILPPDIFSRYNRLLGNQVLMVGGSDQHGTPITVSAEKEGISPEELADRYHRINKKAIEDMGIEYSLYTKTHTENHTEVVQCVFRRLLENGHLDIRSAMQYYCPSCGRFLPDRYVEGVCPECGREDVRGDQCDACGKTFETGEVQGARCIQCGTAPEVRETEHYFLRLSDFRDRLLEYVDGMDHWRSNVRTFTSNWIGNDGLKDRAITRDMDWGVPIPVEGWEGKVIYVWFDAVIGYLSASIEYSRAIGEPDYWKGFWKDPEVRHYYFLGKDNIPFHSIIWPSILMGVGGLNLPYDIPANEYLMFRGGKLSKSRGGAIDIPSVLSKYDTDAVRYYLSVCMPDTHDSEFTWEDFQTKINNELVAALGNYYHRCLSFTRKNFVSIPGEDTEEGSADVVGEIDRAFSEYRECMDACDFKKAVRTVMELARFGNRYFDSVKPWALLKSDREACGRVMNTNLRLVKALAVMAWPFMPRSSERIWGYLGLEGGIEACGYDGMKDPLPVGRELPEPAPVYRKVETESPSEAAPAPQAGKGPEGPFADFRRLDIRVGTVVSADDHPDADKLFLLKVDVGEERQIVAGLKAFYSKEDMVGRRVLVLCNLKPAKLRGQISQGMLLAADDEGLGGNTVLLLKPSSDVPDGTPMNCGMENVTATIDYKDFQKAVLKVASVRDGRFQADGAPVLDLPEGAPARVAAVLEGGSAAALTDGRSCVATVDRDITDGAGVR
ncbi:MAG: methionine--tRNA ligase [Candidatus Methanomethylophilaceae archaeon]|jgi:methionyl-tRNA synthetase|nr:methionine--tRNA ligase [Candidatus Methanomethylophilaceae archaeon]